MQTAHNPEDLEKFACQRLDRDYEFIVDVLDICGGHLWGSAEADFGNGFSNRRWAAEAILKFRLDPVSDAPYGERVTNPAQMLYTGAPGGEASGLSPGFVLNVFAKRKADGRIAHVLRMVPDGTRFTYDAYTTEPEHPDPGYNVSDIFVPLLCAPPRASQPPNCAENLLAWDHGVAWMAAVSARCYAPGWGMPPDRSILGGLESDQSWVEFEVRLCSKTSRLEQMVGVTDTEGYSLERFAREPEHAVNCSMVERLLRNKELITWFTPDCDQS